MSSRDRIKSAFEGALVSLVESWIFRGALVFGAGAVAFLSEWEDVWWAAGLFVSLMTNVFFIQWVNGKVEKVASKDTLIEHLKEQLETAQNNVSANLYVKGEMLEQIVKERQELNQLWSQIHCEPAVTELKYVNMVVCEKGVFGKQRIVVVSLGHSDGKNFHFSNTSLLRFALELHNARKLCGDLAEYLGGTFKPRVINKPPDEIEITDDDIPF